MQEIIRIWKKHWAAIAILVFMGMTAQYTVLKDRSILDDINTDSFSGNIISGFIESGVFFSGDNIDIVLTGNIPVIQTGEVELSEWDKFNMLVESGLYISFSFPTQPTITAGMSYEERSNVLNKYLKNNNRYFSVNSTISSGYIYVKTKKPTDEIFMYWHNNYLGGYKVSGKLITKYSLSDFSSREFLFSLNDISLRSYYDDNLLHFNWQDQITPNTRYFIGGYIPSFDGNKIEEIIIAYE